jgi:DNA-directed RNA polymerase subunit RPC12/RpoP
MEGEVMSIILKGIDPKTDYGLCMLTVNGELITANGKHIQAIPTEGKEGEWIDTANKGLRKLYECSICGGKCFFPNAVSPKPKGRFKYCPYCGTKMKGRNDEHNTERD